MARGVRVPALLLASVMVGLASRPAEACYGGLLVIPTTDITRGGEYSVELQVDGRLSPLQPNTALLNTEFGVGSRVEVGLDLDLSEHPATFFQANGKYVLARSRNERFAAALGCCSVGNHLRSVVYGIGSADLGVARLHAGPALLEGHVQGYFGVDRTFFDKLTAMADYTTGSAGSASVGGNYQFTDRLGLMAGAVFATGGETTFSVHAVWCSKF